MIFWHCWGNYYEQEVYNIKITSKFKYISFITSSMKGFCCMYHGEQPLKTNRLSLYNVNEKQLIAGVK
jgi:hypothetical protein